VLTLGPLLGGPTMRAHPPGREHGAMKKALFIVVAVTALLVLALGGWVASSVRREPVPA